MKKLLFILMIIPMIGFGQTKIRNTQLTSGNQPSGKVLKSDGATNVVWGDDDGGTGHDSLTIAPGSTPYFDVNYPQIFSGQKLIDSLGVINTKIAGKEPILTKGNLTAGSSKVTIGGTGTGAVIGAGASIDVNESNIVHQNISGHGTNTHAQIDTHITNDLDLDPNNEIQDLNLSGNTLSLSGDASTVDLSVFATASGSANYVQVSPASAQSGNINLYGDVKINSLSKQPRTDINYVFEGDSRVAASGIDWPLKLQSLSNFANTGNFINVATGGERIWQIISEYSTQVYPHRPQGSISEAYLFVLIGINDLVDADPNFTTMASDLLSYCNTAKTDGFKVVLFTTFYRQDFTRTQELARLKFNDLLRAGSSNYFMLIDLEELFPSSASNIFYSDVVHLIEQGNTLIANHVNDKFPLGNTGITQVSRYLNRDVVTPYNEFKIDGNFKTTGFYLQKGQIDAYSYNVISLEATDASDSKWDIIAGTNGTLNITQGLSYTNRMQLDASGNVNFSGFVNSPSYKLSGVDLFGSLTTGSRTKWDGTKLIDDTDTFAPVFSGTANYIPKFTGTGTTIGNSPIYADASNNIGIGTASPINYVGIAKNVQIIGSAYSVLTLGNTASAIDNKLWRIISRPDYDRNIFEIQAIDDAGGSEQTAIEVKRSGTSIVSSRIVNGSFIVGSLSGTGTRLVGSQSDGTLDDIALSSGYFYSDGTNMIWIKTEPQSLSGTTPSLNASNGVNANISISGATTLTLSNLVSGTSGTIYLTNNASVYRIKIAGYTIAPASNITYDSTGILLPASSVYTHTSIGWYYNGTTVQIHKADYNTTTY